jgi:hypothetical protein
MSQPVKPGRMSNVPRGLWLRAAGIVAPSLVALLGLAGVTAPPALSIRDAREALEYASSRSEEYTRELVLAQRYSEQSLERRASEVLDALRSKTPAHLDIVVAQGAVQLACARAGLQLSSLVVGGTRDPLLASTRDRIVVQTFEIVARGTLTASVRLQEELHALGYPSCVLQAQLSFELESRQSVDVHLRLGLFHFAPLPPSDPSSSTEPSPDSP